MASLRHMGKRGSLYGVVTLFALFSAFPFFWMVIASFKRAHDLYTMKNNPFFFNEPPTLEHLHHLFFDTLFVKYLINTVVVGIAVVAITLLVAVPAAYSLARWAGRWGENLGISIFLTYLVPPTLLFIPLSRVIGTLGLQESLWSLILIYPTFTIPFCTWLLMGFFKSIPLDIEEQARQDSFVGHVGGDDFVFIVKEDLVETACSKILANFDVVRNMFLSAADIKAGCYVEKDRQGRETTFGLLSLSIAVVLTGKHIFSHSAEVANVASQVKHYVKQKDGSNFMIDRRSGQ